MDLTLNFLKIFFNQPDLTLFFSLFSLGFFGGFAHCSLMCGPFVLTQVNYHLSNIKIHDFSTLKKIQGAALLPYHCGRILTYATMGWFACYLRIAIDAISGFKILASSLLILACLFFIDLFFKQNSHWFNKLFLQRFNFYPKINKKFQQNFIIKKLIIIQQLSIKKILSKVNFLLNNPQGLQGFFLGIILGFIPCQMLYGALAIAANLSHPLLAFLSMIIFGFGTFFALFAVGLFTKISLKLREFKIIANIVIIFNIIFLVRIFLNNFI